MDKIKVAAVGTGYFSRFQYSAWDRIPEVHLVGICNRTRSTAEELADQYRINTVYTDFRQMLEMEKPDLVDIITPPVTHVDYVTTAVELGIPAICQKPFTSSVSDARKLVAIIEDKGGKVIVHENFRFQPWYRKIREILDEGWFGQLYEISFALRPGDGQGTAAYMERQPYFQEMERFLVHETAVHLIDVFRYLFGEIGAVYADLRRVNPVIKGEDAGFLLFDFLNGAKGLFDGNRLSDHCADNRRLTMGEMRIEGERGTLTLDGNGGLRWREHSQNEFKEISYDWIDRDFGGDCVYSLQRHVVDHLLYGKELMNTAKEYLANVEIAEASYVSNEKAVKITLR
ncbi:Gfo/Idh/MocA family oxidoreductase [uncultured Sneathiella sp.]|uniref:Gfo/Idh/MocA family protein n=1 Tax=uncultured Sneathiella sp. TaxID=879315 RepID=UPI0030D891E4|tara:strand:+ start:562 stop:1590 length:1029 start_codon:yes stop_codon:yes gene_type:complete